ncbi:hypothetical protein MTR_7g094160 [Medicago truncatula]|uniref:Uncharacterized protein n=1 Tax=Medicago truncatula TaxID=3880 RepID=A0A072UCW4_MEDTR|nr:hypothetical protein MTR_7g094160 [Medicago truncatula]
MQEAWSSLVYLKGDHHGLASVYLKWSSDKGIADSTTPRLQRSISPTVVYRTTLKQLDPIPTSKTHKPS